MGNKDNEPLSPSDFRNLVINKTFQESAFYKADFQQFHIHQLEKARQYLTTDGRVHRKTIPDLMLLTHGKSIRSIGVQQYELEAPCFFFLPELSMVANHFISEDAGGYYCHFSPTFLEQQLGSKTLWTEVSLFKWQSHPLLPIAETDLAFYEGCFERLLQDYLGTNLYREKLIAQELMNLFFRIQSRHVLIDELQSSHTPLTVKFMKLVSAQSPELVTVEAFASQLHVSANHLNRVMKAETGRTASSFIKDMLLSHAKVMLQQPDRPSISAVADRLQFSTPSHFARFFKTQTGLTPKEYQDA